MANLIAGDNKTLEWNTQGNAIQPFAGIVFNRFIKG